ncbi:MAG: ABC transporter ATP-binding protein [Anaerolineae bacterium]|nr:ABC transporter ATP-binding protein [Anaerolineae bacterium]
MLSKREYPSGQVEHDKGSWAMPNPDDMNMNSPILINRQNLLPISSDETTKGEAAPSMSSDTIISVRNVSKMYPLYAKPGDRLKQSLWYALPKSLRGRSREFYKEFWALHNISFDIKKGETVGIIGRNGSGKSTLLQIIAETLTPTVGEVEIRGRVTALLELGSGFNKEFTGRENVYLNAAILGLSPAEIDAIYDDIVAFADIGRFIDQPVKLYSSGMVVRLAFAVQAFIPKETLIVDEALSVGDEAFRRKCMAVLEKFREQGGTVLLVSHDIQTIVRHCNRCILLSEGQLLVDDASKPVTDLYQKLMHSDPKVTKKILTALAQDGLPNALSFSETQTPFKKHIQKKQSDPSALLTEPTDWFDLDMPQTNTVVYGNGDAEIVDYGLYNEQDQQVNVVVMGQRYKWIYTVQFNRDAEDVHFGIMLKTVDGLNVTGIASFREKLVFKNIAADTVMEITFAFTLNLIPGTYFLNMGVGGRVDDENTYLDRRVDVCMIRVLPRDSRESYGIAYMEPEIQYKTLQQQNSI